MEIVLEGGSFVPLANCNAIYRSARLATVNGTPARGDISKITFIVNDGLEIDFISERYFKCGPAIYTHRRFVEKNKLQLLDQGTIYNILNLKEDYDPPYLYKINLPGGVLQLSEMALQTLNSAIYEEHKSIILDRQKKLLQEEKERQEKLLREEKERQEKLLQEEKERQERLLEVGRMWEEQWRENQKIYSMIRNFTTKYMLHILLSPKKIKPFESWIYRKWMSNSVYKDDILGILQSTQSTNYPASLEESNFNALIKIISKECQWEEDYAVCRTYGAIIGIVKEEAIKECNLVYDLCIEESDSYNSCLKNYVNKVGTKFEDESIFGYFVYYLIKMGKVSFPDLEYAIPGNMGFVCVYRQIQKDIVPLEQEYQESMAIQQLSEELSSENYNDKITVEDLDLMSGQEFEQAIAKIFESMDYKVNTTRTTGDQGIDIIAERNQIRIGIQAKCYSGKVGNSAVQEVVAGRQYYKLNRCMVVTNNAFTKSAVELAEVNNVILWDRKVLEEKVKSLNW